LDAIEGTDGKIHESVGGPPCYSGITSRRFEFEVSLVTRVGTDFPAQMHQLLRENNLILKDLQIVNAPTTKFSISQEEGRSRKMVLNSKCAPLSADDIKDMNVDCWLISPVIDEIPPDVFIAIKQNKGIKKFVMLDPQGFMRVADKTGNIALLDTVELNLSGITAVKVDSREIAALTNGLHGLEGMRYLQSKGIELVIFTERRLIHLLHGNTHYWLQLNEVDTSDSTGAGDILSAAFCCAYLKEKDPLWAISFGAGALRAALETKQVGLAKIPSMAKIEQSSAYFYNTVKFKQLS